MNIVNNTSIKKEKLDQATIEFLDFLVSNGMSFERAGGYWKNQSYWYVKYNDELNCLKQLLILRKKEIEREQ